jgi:hypothetical protein
MNVYIHICVACSVAVLLLSESGFRFLMTKYSNSIIFPLFVLFGVIFDCLDLDKQT